MQQIVVRIPDQQKTAYERMASKENISFSAMVRRALEDYQKNSYLNQKPGKVLMKLADAGKKYKLKSSKNISTTYKKELYK